MEVNEIHTKQLIYTSTIYPTKFTTSIFLYGSLIRHKHTRSCVVGFTLSDVCMHAPHTNGIDKALSSTAVLSHKRAQRMAFT